MATFTKDDRAVVRAVREVIAERGPDFIYQPKHGIQCVYSADLGLTGSCLVGAALIDKLGVKYHPNWEHNRARKLLTLNLRERLGYIHPSIATAVNAAQLAQDGLADYATVSGIFERNLKQIGYDA